MLRLVSSAYMPSPLPRQVRWSLFAHLSVVSGLPCEKVRSAPAIVVSGPAQRSLTLWPARSPSRLTTLYTESSDSFVASAIVSIATGWSEPVPGREFHPLKSSAFHGALSRQQHLLPSASRYLNLRRFTFSLTESKVFSRSMSIFSACEVKRSAAAKRSK